MALKHSSGVISSAAAVYQKAQFLGERADALDAWAEEIDHLKDKAEGLAPEPLNQQRGACSIQLGRASRALIKTWD